MSFKIIILKIRLFILKISITCTWSKIQKRYKRARNSHPCPPLPNFPPLRELLLIV